MIEKRTPKTLLMVFRSRLPAEIITTAALCALVYYAVQKLDVVLLWKHVSNGVDRGIMWSFLWGWMVFITNALRLRVLISTSFYASYQIVNIGSLLNVALPFRLGDVARVYVSRRYFGVPSGNVLIATVVEKFCDLTAVLLLANFAILAGAVIDIPRSTLFVLFGVTGASGIGVWVIWRFNLLEYLLAPLPEFLTSQIQVLIAGLASRSATKIGVYTCFIWIVNVGCAFVTFSMLLPGVQLTMVDAISLTVIAALAVAVPGAPAGLGIFEAGVVVYLTQVRHVSGELALASALIFHAVLVISPLFGVFVGTIRKIT